MTFKRLFDSISHFFSPQPASLRPERYVAALGGCLSIFLITKISIAVTGFSGAAAIVPSMGASTVLLFAVPHGPMSQPWALFAGNLLSAMVGVSCARWVTNPILAACLAVGLAIGVMHLCRCIHPPGGATALAAVIGGSAIHDLGYAYVLTPTLLNCLVIFCVALAFNNLFPWRRYPLSLMKYQITPLAPNETFVPIRLRHLVEACEKADVMIDVAPEQLFELVQHAEGIARQEQCSDIPIVVGAFYTNDKPGREWSVRQVLEEDRQKNPHQDRLIYRVVDGKDIHHSGCATRQEFAMWMKRRVRPKPTATQKTPP